MTSSTPRYFSIRRLAIFDDRERRQPKEVHLEKVELLDAAHVVLRDDFVLVRLVKRDEFLQRSRRDHDAGGMDRAVARHAFELAATSSTSPTRGSALRISCEARLLRERFLQLDVELIRYQLGDAVDFADLHVEHAADIFDRRARAQRTERDDLRDLLAPVLFGDVLDHFAAPVRAEVDIDIGHADALGIEEALEQQAVLQRIDIGDLHRVADQAAGGGSAARTDRDVDGSWQSG